MDDFLLDALGRALVRLSVDGPGLDDLLEPRTPASGENAGKPPARRGSKPPLSVSILDLKIDTQGVLYSWCTHLASANPDQGAVGGSASIAECADWLHERILVLETMPWGRRCAEEVIATARLVSDVVMPPARANDPEPIEVGTAREMAAWSRLMGRPVSRSSIQRAIANGAISHELAPDGRVLVRLADVLKLRTVPKVLDVGHPSC